MAKSRTKRKTIEVDDVKALANAASTYIKHWAKEQAKQIANTDLVIIPANWGFQVARYSVKEANGCWSVYNKYDELVNSFTSKQSAITWCLLEQSKMYSKSERLLSQDIKLGKLLQDHINYTRNRQRAIKKQDMFTVDVLDARIAETLVHLDYAKIDLEKTLISAKYLKGIWEKPL